MTLSEMMELYGFEPKQTYKGIQTANDMVLAIDFTKTAADPNDFLVAEVGILEHSGTLDPTAEESEYMRTGKSSTRTSVSRKIEIKGDVHLGDAFQDKLLDHKTKYGTGSSIIFEYVYFSVLSGKGERGYGMLSIEEDSGGAAGGKNTLGAVLTSVGTPKEYIYSAASGD